MSPCGSAARRTIHTRHGHRPLQFPSPPNRPRGPKRLGDTARRSSPALEKERTAGAPELSLSQHGHPVAKVIRLLHEVGREQGAPARPPSPKQVPGEAPRVRIHPCGVLSGFEPGHRLAVPPRWVSHSHQHYRNIHWQCRGDGVMPSVTAAYFVRGFSAAQ